MANDEKESVNIRIKTETWRRLRDEYKTTPGKTWDDVLQELLADAEAASECAEGSGEEPDNPNQSPPLAQTQTAD